MTDSDEIAPMTAARLTEIEAMTAAATPPPWIPDTHDHRERGCRCMSCRVVTGWHVVHSTTEWCSDHPEADHASETCDTEVLPYEDAVFAAAARTFVPELLAEVHRSHAENAKLSERATLLSAMEAAGVDNWEGMSKAYGVLDEWREEDDDDA